MTTARQREIVIEFEKVQTIRKRAKTRLISCLGCDAEADTVSLADAAELFETDRDALFQFIRQHDCHYQVEVDDRIYLCVPSLLDKMQQQKTVRRLTARGE